MPSKANGRGHFSQPVYLSHEVGREQSRITLMRKVTIMQIFSLNEYAISAGKAAFHRYRTAVTCGRASEIYEAGMCRQTGLSVVPGAIVACIEQGSNSEDEIVHAVARVSLCRRSTVSAVLYALCGGDPHRHLWRATKRGDFELHDHACANVVFAA